MGEKMIARTLLDFENALLDLFENNRITIEASKIVWRISGDRSASIVWRSELGSLVILPHSRSSYHQSSDHPTDGHPYLWYHQSSSGLAPILRYNYNHTDCCNPIFDGDDDIPNCQNYYP
jgi:hypothetical protein